MPVDIYFAKIRENAIIPEKRTEDAGYDIYACFDDDYVKLDPHQTCSISTGIASSCSDEYYFQLMERGSTGTKGIGQRCGVIDSGYRGEWFVPLTNHNIKPLYFVKPEKVADLQKMLGDSPAVIYPTNKAICQALLLPVPRSVVHELSYDDLMKIESERGTWCLGSSEK